METASCASGAEPIISDRSAAERLNVSVDYGLTHRRPALHPIESARWASSRSSAPSSRCPETLKLRRQDAPLDRRRCGALRLADMEGPTVKRFVTAPSMSSLMLRSGHFSDGRERFPEDAGARLTMERLRRRIRLICAGCSEEQSRMTPLRRELPPSRGASRPDPKTGRRIASARTLQSCSHRAVADAAREPRSHCPRPLLGSVTMVTPLAAGSRVES